MGLGGQGGLQWGPYRRYMTEGDQPPIARDVDVTLPEIYGRGCLRVSNRRVIVKG